MNTDKNTHGREGRLGSPDERNTPAMKKIKAAAEQAEQEARQARARAALRWSDASDIGPDVPPPAGWNELSTGWMFNRYSRRVEIACSSSINHAIGRTDKTTAQRPIALYSTRKRALRALRVALEHEFAAELKAIDDLLEEEQS